VENIGAPALSFERQNKYEEGVKENENMKKKGRITKKGK
jgi:hypothetical protein